MSQQPDLRSIDLDAQLKSNLIQLCRTDGVSHNGLKMHLVQRLHAPRAWMPPLSQAGPPIADAISASTSQSVHHHGPLAAAPRPVSLHRPHATSAPACRSCNRPASSPSPRRGYNRLAPAAAGHVLSSCSRHPL